MGEYDETCPDCLPKEEPLASPSPAQVARELSYNSYVCIKSHGDNCQCAEKKIYDALLAERQATVEACVKVAEGRHELPMSGGHIEVHPNSCRCGIVIATALRATLGGKEKQ